MAAITLLAIGSGVSMAYPSESSVKDGFIVQSSQWDSSVLVRENHLDHVVKFPRMSVSQLDAPGKRIVCLSRPVERLDSLMSGKSASCDLLLIGKGFKGRLAQADSLFSPELILIHPGISRDQERVLLAEADSVGLKVHSIRNQNPYIFKLR